jgi:hypothetical protein
MIRMSNKMEGGSMGGEEYFYEIGPNGEKIMISKE